MISYTKKDIPDLFKKNNINWSRYLKLFVTSGLRNYKVKCPICNKGGMPYPKWKKGIKDRYVYIVHSKNSEIQKICQIPNKNIDGLNLTIKLNDNDIIKLFKFDNIFILFSGGKDSLCTLYYINALCERIKKPLQAIFIDTTVCFPEVRYYVEKTCKEWGIPLNIVKPENDYYTLAKEWGIPNFKSRWCCRELKIKPIQNFLSNQKGTNIVLDGIRAVESNDRAKYFPIWYHPGFNTLSISPIFFWLNKEIEEYIDKNNLPRSPVEHLNSSCECWCGAYKKKSDFEELLNLHPEIYEKLIEVEEANTRGFTFIYKNGQRTSLKELKDEILLKTPN